jgi:hypothetical protein
MLGILTKIVSKARSDDSMAERWADLRKQNPDDTGQTGPGGVESTLYECPSCDIVYVATEKTDCGNCDGTVEPIQDSPELPSTPSDSTSTR